jgi:outer membrane murein-binding lipoprotein Lpp
MSMIIGAAVSAGVSIVGGIIGGGKARRAKRRAAKKLRKMNAKMAQLEANRQEIINPYEDSTNLSSMMSNPMANLAVATQATEMQMEETDQALANTLDTIRQTGGGAGSATALAQAALKSKQGITANIEAQEKSNEQARQQGEQRLQDAKINEEKRMQSLDAAGKQFVFGQRESREMGQLNRLQSQIDNMQGIKAQASRDQTSALTGAISGVAGAASSYFGAKSGS